MPDFDALDYTRPNPGILARPANERPFLLLPVGYPAPDARVPRLARKPLEGILAWNRPPAVPGGAGGLDPTET